jgi:hypothetical protein
MPEGSSYLNKTKDFFATNAKKIPEFINMIKTIFTKILDIIVNGFTMKEKGNEVKHKYYRYFISIVLILILCLFYYLNEKQNIFAIKNTKYEILLTLMLILFSIYCFLFFVYRNNTDWDSDTLYKDTLYKETYKKRSLIKNDDSAPAATAAATAAVAADATASAAGRFVSTAAAAGRFVSFIEPAESAAPAAAPPAAAAASAPPAASTSKSSGKYLIDTDVLKKTLTTPLFNIMKYIFYLLLIILIPLFIINYTLYLHKTNDSIFNITKNIILILLLLVVLAIIAAIFSIKTSSESDVYCKIDTNGKEDVSYIKLITGYAKYFLCIFKNLIFFLPCLLVILVSEINSDIRLTPSPVYILFFILLLLILLLFLLPVVYKFIRTINKSDILQGEGPFYLNKERSLGKYQNLNTNLSKSVVIPNVVVEEKEQPSDNKLDKIMDAFNIDKQAVTLQVAGSVYKSKEWLSTVYNDGVGNSDRKLKDASNNGTNMKGNVFTLFSDANSQYNIKGEYYDSVVSKDKFPYNYTYSVTFYIYLNPQAENTSLAYTKDTVLFNYAFKPVIYYNGKSQKIIIKSRTVSNRGDQLDTIYELANPKFQKWLFFVINYDNNVIDVFIDGKLVGSKANVVPYFKGDNITIGENDGIHGSIKEIYYYDKITTPSTIELLYNLSKNTD